MTRRRKPYRQRVPLPDLLTWTGVFLFLAFFGALYASVRNAQILAGTEATTLEHRVEQLRQEVEGLTLTRERLLEPAALQRRLRRMNSRLRPIQPGQLVVIPLDPPSDPLLAAMLERNEKVDAPSPQRGGVWRLLPPTPALEIVRHADHSPRVSRAGLMLDPLASKITRQDAAEAPANASP